MKQLGCLLAVIGLFCFVVCLWIFGNFVAQKVAALTGDASTPTETMVVYSTSLSLNQKKMMTGLKVKRGEHAQLAVGLLFKKDSWSDQSYEYKYQVLNQKGQKIFVDQGIFSTQKSKVPMKEQWLDGQKAQEFYLGSFPLPDSRTIEIRFTLSGKHQALDKAQLRVYSLEKSSNTMSLTSGILLLALSCALAVVGLFLFIVGKTEEMEEVLS